jgi:hypothetical protein
MLLESDDPYKNIHKSHKHQKIIESSKKLSYLANSSYSVLPKKKITLSKNNVPKITIKID